MLTPLQPPTWARARGYAHGIKARGSLVFTSSQFGWDEQGCLRARDYICQVGQALKNIVAVLAEAGAEPAHLVRLTWYVADKDAYQAGAREVGILYREIIGNYNVTMSAFQVAALMVEDAMVQIEAIAVVPDE